MAYNKGKYPYEAASKIAHMEVIRDSALVEVLQSLRSDEPGKRPNGCGQKTGTVNLDTPHDITTVITVDGGLSIVPNPTRREKRVAFIQVGTMLLSLQDLDRISQDPFMDPRILKSYLDRVDRDPLIVPLSGVRRANRSIRDTNREILNSILSPAWTGLYDVLEFLLWREWQSPGDEKPKQNMDCVGCGKQFPLPHSREFSCPYCGFDHFLSDYLGLNSDSEDFSTDQLAKMIMATVELLALFRLPMRLVQLGRPEKLSEFLLIKDGPLMLRAQGYKVIDGVRALIEWLHAKKHPLKVVGIEKTGDFSEFLNNYSDIIPEPGDFFLPSRRTILEEIQGAKFDESTHRNRVSFGTRMGVRLSKTHVVALQLPTRTLTEGGPLEPVPMDMPFLEEIVAALASLTSSSHDNALLPLVLANRAVSLSDKPSSGILENYLNSVTGTGK